MRTTPIIEIFPPHKNPPFETPDYSEGFWAFIAGFFCNENPKFTLSLLCLLFTKLTGECNHSRGHSLFWRIVLANAPPFTCALVCPTRMHTIECEQTNRSEKGKMILRCKGSFQSQITRAFTSHFFRSRRMVRSSLQSHSHIHSDHANSGH